MLVAHERTSMKTMQDILNLFKEYEIDWTAAAAIATFMAVFVALLPICHEKKKQRNMAASLRGQILIKLFLLRHSLKKLAAAKYMGKSKFSDEDLNAIRSLEILTSNSTVLDPQEQSLLIATVGHLIQLSALMQSDETHKVPQEASFILDILSPLVDTLDLKRVHSNRNAGIMKRFLKLLGKKKAGA